MGVLSKILTASGSSVIDSIGKAIDDNVTSTEERMKLDLEIKKVMSEADAVLAQETTKRWESDNKSGAITRLFRPVISNIMILTFLYLLVLGTPTDMQIHYLFSLVEVIIISYFGGRTLEKSISILKGNGAMKAATSIIDSKEKVGFLKKIFKRK